MQWDVAVNHTHQSRAGAQKRLPVQRKLAFLVFQGKKSFCASQTLAVPAHLTWISIFSGALTQHCTGIRKMHSNVGFSAHLWDDLRWNHSLVGSWGGLSGSAAPEPCPRWAAGEGRAGKASEGDTERRGLGNIRSAANQMCPQRKSSVWLNIPLARAWGSRAEGMFWSSRSSLEPQPCEEIPVRFPAG